MLETGLNLDTFFSLIPLKNSWKIVNFLVIQICVHGYTFKEACRHSLQVFSVLWPSLESRFSRILFSRNANSQTILLHNQVDLHLQGQGPGNWELWVYKIFSWKFSDFQTIFETFIWFEILDSWTFLISFKCDTFCSLISLAGDKSCFVVMNKFCSLISLAGDKSCFVVMNKFCSLISFMMTSFLAYKICFDMFCGAKFSDDMFCVFFM